MFTIRIRISVVLYKDNVELEHCVCEFRELKFCVSFLSNKKSEFLLSLSSYIHSSLTNNRGFSCQ